MARSNNNNNKKTKGKEKIEIKFIDKEEERLLTFAKRKAEIFKKVNELATMTGSEVAIVLGSPTEGGKPYSFGHPSADSIIKRFLEQEKMRDMASLVVEAKGTSDMNVQNSQLDTKLVKAEKDKEKSKNLTNDEGAEAVETWWTTPIEHANKEDLVETMNVYNKVLEEVYSKFLEKTRNNSGEASSSGSFNVSPLRVPAELIPRFPTPPKYE